MGNRHSYRRGGGTRESSQTAGKCDIIGSSLNGQSKRKRMELFHARI